MSRSLLSSNSSSCRYRSRQLGTPVFRCSAHLIPLGPQIGGLESLPSQQDYEYRGSLWAEQPVDRLCRWAGPGPRGLPRNRVVLPVMARPECAILFI